jgi:hypothetical protein
MHKVASKEAPLHEDQPSSVTEWNPLQRLSTEGKTVARLCE